MRVMVIGSGGQLGVDLVRCLGPAALAIDHAACDVRDADRVAAVIRQHRPSVVVNCAAATNVDQAEDDVQSAFDVNARAALYVARSADEIGALVVYVSTDYVFGDDPSRLLPYVESDRPGPLNVYGTSKLAGEHLTLGSCRRAVVVRTASLYGHAGARGKGGNFVETMLRLAREGRQLRVVCDQIMTPMSTAACARRIADMIQCNVQGLYHVASADACSWYEFACAIFRHSRLDPQVTPVPLAAYPNRARRPLYSALASERVGRLGLPPAEDWQSMLHEYLETRPSAATHSTITAGVGGK